MQTPGIRAFETIIECLKYATTGDLPPNTGKGAAFVHDPQIAGETDVKGQVKLLFRNTNNIKMICVRSVQCTIKKGTRSFKSLESQLTAHRSDNERSTISNRCAELDAQMPISLGVSKSILENVIFCHQEDSSWPLSDPSTLKKKFDEIFEALRYTKALDQIKSIRKEQQAQVKIDEATLLHYKSDKERAEKVKAEQDETNGKIQIFQDRVAKLDEQLRKITQQQDDLFRFNQEFQKTIAELAQYRQEKTSLESNLEELLHGLEILEDSDSELESKRKRFEDQLKTGTAEKNRKKDERNRLSEDLNSLRSILSRLLSEQGKYRAEAEAHERHIQTREELVKSISEIHGFKGFEMRLDERRINDFRNRLSHNLNEQKLLLENTKSEGRNRESEITSKLQEKMAKQSSYDHEKSAARNQIRSIETKLNDVQLSHDNISINEDDVILVQSKLEREKSELQKLKDDLQTVDYEEKIKTKNSELREIDEKLESLNEETVIENQHAETRAKLTMMRDESESKEAILQRLLSTTKIRAADVLGGDPDISGLDSTLSQVLRHKKNRHIESAETDYETANRGLAALQTRMTMVEESVTKMKSQKTDYRNQLDNLCPGYGPNSYLVYIDELKGQVAEASEQINKNQGGIEILTHAKNYLEKQNACFLCRRRFEGEDDKGDFLTAILSRNDPKKLEEGKGHLKKLEDTFRIAQSKEGIYQWWKNADTEINLIQREYQELNERMDEAAQDAEAKKDAITKARSEYRKAEELRKPIAELARLREEIKKLKVSIEDREGELANSGSTRTIEEIRNEVTSLNESSRRLKRELNTLTAERDKRRQTINTLENKVRDTRLEMHDVTQKLETRKELQKRIGELREVLDKLSEDITKAEEAAKTIAPEIAQLRTKLTEHREEQSQREHKLQDILHRLNQSMTRFHTANREIQNYIETNGPTQLEDTREQIKNTENQFVELELRISKISDEMAQFEKETSSYQTFERQISDNLRIRRMQRKIEQLDQDIRDLEAKNAERDRDQYQDDSEKLKQKHGRLFSERAGLLGEIKQMDNQLAKFEKELETEFKNAHENYRKQYIKVKTIGAANDDLQKYGKALDNAIMKYHSLKMEDINRIVDELWKSTYSGSDVDTIIIRSDNETARGNRSYNYRVCMVKGTAELDMRGRCSAGQKVLACLIIRLALAECFGTNCGILALDEPTTNLDKENAESLARSLNAIIKARRQQNNFQLIVITHDEAFLAMMGCAEYADKYWRISRNERSV
ncbi:DNA repair protein rad50 [Neolecta irregularis DAH-3]|uniref:DNA repair protein rad50 n=1 Tax=Neolecta irregularis (strain DAH-3) TaxID=1198029 RepID=A0A1U7LWY6_NEOID|nr:DNA repair protein rad50 [Neolecta irregularis DAH-3]|eukprot:OLL27062.1 DNA repair protein rad50 [Neolecta irregularis DAH-3]